MPDNHLDARMGKKDYSKEKECTAGVGNTARQTQQVVMVTTPQCPETTRLAVKHFRQ